MTDLPLPYDDYDDEDRWTCVRTRKRRRVLCGLGWATVVCGLLVGFGGGLWLVKGRG